ncbi:MAG: anti-sigma factor [Planctomycetota bacterium]
MTRSKCREHKEQLGTYVDGMLSDGECLRLESHLESCEDCRNECANLRTLIAGLAALPPVAIPKELWPRLESALREERNSSQSSTLPLTLWQRLGRVRVAAGILALTFGAFVLAREHLSNGGDVQGVAAENLVQHHVADKSEAEEKTDSSLEGRTSVSSRAVMTSVRDAAHSRLGKKAAPQAKSARGALSGGKGDRSNGRLEVDAKPVRIPVDEHDEERLDSRLLETERGREKKARAFLGKLTPSLPIATLKLDELAQFELSDGRLEGWVEALEERAGRRYEKVFSTRLIRSISVPNGEAGRGHDAPADGGVSGALAGAPTAPGTPLPEARPGSQNFDRLKRRSRNKGAAKAGTPGAKVSKSPKEMGAKSKPRAKKGAVHLVRPESRRQRPRVLFATGGKKAGAQIEALAKQLKAMSCERRPIRSLRSSGLKGKSKSTAVRGEFLEVVLAEARVEEFLASLRQNTGLGLRVIATAPEPKSSLRDSVDPVSRPPAKSAKSAKDFAQSSKVTLHFILPY